MTPARLALPVLAVSLLALIPAQLAFADGGRKPLTGEEMLVQDATVDFDCDPTSISTVTWSASGVATGPYPGTFTVQGSAMIGPQPPSVPSGTLFVRPTVSTPGTARMAASNRSVSSRTAASSP